MYDNGYGEGVNIVIEREREGLSHRASGTNSFKVEPSWSLNEAAQETLIGE